MCHCQQQVGQQGQLSQPSSRNCVSSSNSSMCISCGLVVLMLQVQAGVLLLVVAGAVDAATPQLLAQHCKLLASYADAAGASGVVMAMAGVRVARQWR
jgi:hypothetical protein